MLIALGGNLVGQKDSPLEYLQDAICEFSQSGIDVKAQSRVYRTPCFPAGAGPDFLNAALVCVTDLTPASIMRTLHDIESRAGRTRVQRWAPRVLDLDLLAVGDLICPDIARYRDWAGLDLQDQMRLAPGELILPHPRMHERRFVLVPLLELWPEAVDPRGGTPYAGQLDQLPAQGIYYHGNPKIYS